ncbi:hypothetical protein [Stakelama tenebrarum]|uniref:UrcA family protein n=1 Tax=Stakelama tenebrarum TaxID=2711215 RepID=A0A6G6Y2A6_9SPHN|nr:hypothetical protein [Sphingosinithalassobacter tenebrarum]QIG79029.1 hypothetical protein G5C33_04015 [Sphingosinithalassobacter tenebrarum]
MRLNGPGWRCVAGALLMGVGLAGAPAAVAQEASEAQATSEVEPGPVRIGTVTTTRSIAIPDEIAPVVFPYMSCLEDSRGAASYSDGRQRKPQYEEGADCTSVREKAARDADARLRRSGMRNRAERERVIEKALSDIEDLHDMHPGSPDEETR